MIVQPCFRWGTRHSVDSLSHTWNLGRQSRRKLWQICAGNLHPTCAAGALTSPLFASPPLSTQAPTTSTTATAWPRGTYSLPKAASGCSPGFSSGCVFQDNEDSGNENRFSNTQYLSGQFNRNIRMCYCTRTSSRGSTSWPRGRYCIAKKGSCPRGFRTGELYWDDEDSGNINAITGVVPDGIYNRDTRIRYCCRGDGSSSTAMRLPTSNPFVLYQFQSRGCQRVAGMRYHEISITFDDEDNRNANSCSGSRPYDPGCPGRNHHLYLCYYTS
jgi:hypothetical protein